METWLSEDDKLDENEPQCNQLKETQHQTNAKTLAFFIKSGIAYQPFHCESDIKCYLTEVNFDERNT